MLRAFWRDETEVPAPTMKSSCKKTKPVSKEDSRSNYQFTRTLTMEGYIQNTPKILAKSRIRTNSRGQITWFLQQENST